MTKRPMGQRECRSRASAAVMPFENGLQRPVEESDVNAVKMGSRDLDEWIGELTRRGWTHLYVPDRAQPLAMASTYWYSGYVDVIQLFPEEDAFAYRAPCEPRQNPYTPASVVWQYGGTAVWTVRAMLALPEPGSAYAPKDPMPAPPMARTLPSILGRVRRSVIRPPATPPEQRPQA